MQKEFLEQARGLDTQVRLVVVAAIAMIGNMLFAPWFSMKGATYSSQKITGKIFGTCDLTVCVVTVFLIVALAVTAVCVCIWRKRAVSGARIVFGLAALLPIYMMILVVQANRSMEDATLRLTAYPYAQLLAAILLVVGMEKLLDTQRVDYVEVRSEQEDGRISIRTKTAVVLIILAIPAVIAFGVLALDDRSYYFISMCIIILAMLPFLMIFEGRRPKAREIIVIAVMAAIAVAGRAAFFMIPFFKPVAALVIITGISLGAEAGFLTGAVAAFVSNFFFGQGPWTPWQMFAFGIIGFLAGLFFRGRRSGYRHNRIVVCVFGGIATLIIYGIIMDTASVQMYMGKFSGHALLASYISGFPVNLIHAFSTVVFLYLLAEPMQKKLERIKNKYGMLRNEQGGRK